ncbi:MHS family MFS transporter [Pseudonocardia eucalypti]|uniref:MHS family MFS transporter n=1 Tax=Pseudonocardia eucalypti TaxID=648755 RepID=A0ABP9QLA3_9PSEU|nr:MFS family permease [Pseudonocardia eucalypti]
MTGDTTPTRRRVAAASFVGTMIEFYDFFCYGTAAALVFPSVFFPALGSAAGTVAAMATFAVAFVARPLGSALFGHLGDRLGRKRTLIYTLTLMGLATFGVGLLPGAATIGVAAPVILVGLRLLQGLAVGGEWGGAALLAVEYAPEGRRGRQGMYPQLGPGVAVALSSATFLASGLLMSREAFLEWGWRVPFLVSVVLLGVGLFVRLRIAETPVFHELLARGGRPAAPVRTALAGHSRSILLAGGALSAAFGLNYLGTVYLTNYATGVLRVPMPTMLGLGVLGGVLLALATGFGAWVSDRAGRRRVVLLGNAAAVVVSLALFPVIDAGGVPRVGLMLGLSLIAGGLTLGPAAAYVAELFPTECRYTASGICYNLATIVGGAVPPVLAGALLASYGSWAIGVMMAALGVLGLACAYVLPDTRDRSLLGPLESGRPVASADDR